MTNWLTVFLYELRQQSRRKSYLLLTFGLPVLILAAFFIYQTYRDIQDDGEDAFVSIEGAIGRFVDNVRALSIDPVVVRQNWLRAYEFTTDRGALALNDYARANDPFAKVGKRQIAIEVSSVIRASPESFRVAWIERGYENGQLAATERWTAIITIALQQPRDAERLKQNPLGIYVNAINWSKELGQ